MNFKTNASAVTGFLAAAVMAYMPQVTRAQDLILDDFSTGAGKLGPISSGSRTATQTGSGVIGGTRWANLDIGKASSNEFRQPSDLQFLPSTSPNVPSAMVWTAGYKANARIEVGYGNDAFIAPLNLNLTSYDRLRVNFDGLTQVLNFNVEAWYGPNGTTTATLGCNLPSSGPFSLDLPLAAFKSASPLDWSSIAGFYLIFQGDSSLAITGFSAIPASDPPGSVVCGAI
jgi:hypothetical protein